MKDDNPNIFSKEVFQDPANPVNVTYQEICRANSQYADRFMVKIHLWTYPKLARRETAVIYVWHMKSMEWKEVHSLYEQEMQSGDAVANCGDDSSMMRHENNFCDDAALLKEYAGHILGMTFE